MLHVALTLAVFALTLALIFLRPRGLHEAWATMIGAGLILLLGQETPMQAWRTTAQGADILAFLLALMLLASLLDRSGFFEWAAVLAARAARGDGRALYRNVFLLGAVVTALLSLDTSAIILTPIVLAFVQRLKLSARPFLLACAFIANTGSLLLPISNLTNLLFHSAFHATFGEFTLRMALPQIIAVAVNYFVFRQLFRHELPARFEMVALPDARSVVPDLPYFRGALAVLGLVLVGYFVGSLRGVPPYLVAGAGCLVLLALCAARGRLSRDILGDFSWPLFPFVVGLFVVIRGVENLGLTHYAAEFLALAGQSALAQIYMAEFGAAIGSNIVNNIPMALLSISVLQRAHASLAAQYGALLGCNLGPNLTVSGSLATMLVIVSARKKGERISAAEFFRAGAWTTPLLLLAAGLGLWVVTR